ncbi:MAG TPA: EamA family transporter [Ornithinimicrobium sp.]|nr:EamA family transporter [Ornithinimicrobium sp.]HKJ11596.1 EamA family transporter [Ornithinimicrobium sp.]
MVRASRSALRTQSTGPAVPPVALVLAAVVSVQFGGAMAALLLPLVGVVLSVALRLVLAALVLLATVRPRVRGRTRSDWMVVTWFALTLVGMNLAFYGSLARLPLGVAVTIEFLGPLTLAAVLSRRLSDGVAVVAALVGVVLISEVASVGWTEIDVVGVGLAATAGAGWAAYILASERTGARFTGLDGMAVAMSIGAVLMLAVSALAGRSAGLVLHWEVLGLGFTVALLSSAVPYSLELLALRRLATAVFGVLLSLEPAVAAFAGLLVLGQTLDTLQISGMALVVLASITVLGRPRPRGHTTAAAGG